ncbi:MAG: response regulator, partial [Candidatus Marinimicrobia bacterium]|nr:response regulator [Candidatus Neomarinimicrobiota bacterium]
MFYKDILLIDDSEPFCISIQEVLEDNDWSVVYNTNPESGLEFLEVKRFKVVLLDIRMPIMSGLEFLAELVKRGLIQRNYVIVLTGEITIENAVDSLRLGAKDFIQKHAVVEYPDLFLERIEKGFLWQQERIENERLAEERKRAIEESRLIVKSVGHDMSGSY